MNIFGKNRGLELTKHLVAAKGYHSLLVIDKCVLITSNIKVHILESIYDMICGSEIRYRVEKYGGLMKQGK
jgi:hypothetical protein